MFLATCIFANHVTSRLVSMNFGLFGVPKTIQKWTPNHVQNRLPFRHVFSAQLGPILGPFWAPQIRPKIACWAMLALLAALELHLGTPRSFPSQFGLLRRPFGALRGGICTPFWPPRVPFRPSMTPFWSSAWLIGSPSNDICVNSHSLAALFRSTCWKDNVWYDGVRGSV